MAKAPTIAEASREQLLKLKNKTTGLGSWQQLGADNQAAINARLAELDALDAKAVSDTKPIDAGSSNNDRLTISEYSTRMSDITKQLGIYEKDKPAPRRGYTSSYSPDNPYLDGGMPFQKSQWEKEQTTTYEERQAEAREAIAGDLEKFHSDFKSDYGYNWDDRQALLDIDKAWSFDAPTIEDGTSFSDAYQYNALLNQLQAGGKGEGSYSQLEDRWDADYDVRYDPKSTTQDHARMDDWGFDLMRTPQSFASADQMLISGKELDKYTGQHAHLGDAKIPISKQKLQEYGMQFDEDLSDGPHLWDSYKEKADAFGLDSSAEARSLYNDQLYDHLYSNEVDWDLYNQQDSMCQKAAQIAREDADLANLANEERVGIFGIDWMNNTDSEGNPYGKFDREDEIRQVNKWMADRGWVLGDESTWNTELLPQHADPTPQPLDVSGLDPQPLDVSGLDSQPLDVSGVAGPQVAGQGPATEITPSSLIPDDWMNQIGNLFEDYTAGIQDNLSNTFSQGLDSIKDIYSTQFDAQQDLYDQGISALTDQLTGYQGDLTGLQDQLGNLEGQLGHVDTKLEDVNTIQQSLTDIMKDWQEHQIDQGERARAKASYGNLAGRTLNPRVKGVKTLPEIEQPNFFGGFGGARGSFNRKGDRISNLKISNVNVA